MICVGVNADQHDYEPLEKGVYKGSRLIVAICRKCGKFL